MKGEHSIETLCEVLGVSRSGYYRWKTAPSSKRKSQDAQLASRIAVHHRKSRGNYGSPRILAELRAEGLETSRRRCLRLMREQGLRGKKRHRRKPRKTDSSHGQPVAPNILQLLEKPTAPNQAWATDITYIDTGEGWLYLVVILDLWSRRVVGWACAPTMASTLVLAALQDALRRWQPKPGLMHHSDRGSQYVDSTYVEDLANPDVSRS